MEKHEMYIKLTAGPTREQEIKDIICDIKSFKRNIDALSICIHISYRQCNKFSEDFLRKEQKKYSDFLMDKILFLKNEYGVNYFIIK